MRPIDPELLNFLIERTKDAKSPLSERTLAKEFIEKRKKKNRVSSQKLRRLRFRINKFRPKIHQINSIDTETKVKMLFALSVPIQESFLNELQKNAYVEVDEKKRITKYKAHDGSSELEGDHTQSAEVKEGWKKRKMRGEKSSEDSDDGSKDPVPKAPESTKRAAAPEVPNSSKRTRDSSLNRYIDCEIYMDDDIEVSESSTAPHSGAQQPVQSKQKEAAPGATSNPKSGVNDAYTPQIKFLEAIQFIVLNLDMPSLSPIQAKIDKMLRESSNEKIPNNEMVLAMEVLITKITNNSLAILPESGETVSLKVFLCYLKAAIFNSKLEDLETLMEKIKERINEPASKDKKIPVEKVARALQNLMYTVGF